MKHGMAIGAYRAKVCDWVHLVFTAHGCQVFQVVNMDKAFSKVAIEVGKVENTNRTIKPVMVQASLSGSWVAFVCVDGNGTRCPFNVQGGRGYFVGFNPEPQTLQVFLPQCFKS